MVNLWGGGDDGFLGLRGRLWASGGSAAFGFCGGEHLLPAGDLQTFRIASKTLASGVRLGFCGEGKMMVFGVGWKILGERGQACAKN